MNISKIVRWGALAATIVTVPVAIASLGGASAQAATSGVTCTSQACIFLKPVNFNEPLSVTNGDPVVSPPEITYTDLNGKPQKLDIETGKNLPSPLSCTNGCVFDNWRWPTAPSEFAPVIPNSGYAELNGVVKDNKIESGTLIDNVNTSSFFTINGSTVARKSPPYYPICIGFAIYGPGANVNLTYSETAGWIQYNPVAEQPCVGLTNPD